VTTTHRHFTVQNGDRGDHGDDVVRAGNTPESCFGADSGGRITHRIQLGWNSDLFFAKPRTFRVSPVIDGTAPAHYLHDWVSASALCDGESIPQRTRATESLSCTLTRQ
jgi:hypothetical protein